MKFDIYTKMCLKSYILKAGNENEGYEVLQIYNVSEDKR